MGTLSGAYWATIFATLNDAVHFEQFPVTVFPVIISVMFAIADFTKASADAFEILAMG